MKVLAKEQCVLEYSTANPSVLTVAPGEMFQLQTASTLTHPEVFPHKTIVPVTGPVFVDGALLACGDVHAAMGDGESVLSAVEAEASLPRCCQVLEVGSMSGAFDSFSLFISPDLSLPHLGIGIKNMSFTTVQRDLTK